MMHAGRSHPSGQLQEVSPPDESALTELVNVIGQIGVARFAGRISSGVVEAEVGYAALKRFADLQDRRSLWSEVTDVLFARQPHAPR